MQVSTVFYLKKGLAVFRMTHSGRSNFAIQLYNADTGAYEALLVNEIGPFNGSTVESIGQAGNYMLNINADGAWTISVAQGNL